ncbi:ABC transporter permease [Polymorphobacter fuscus]|uniref:FtsX-like permease family protein n=1 Tax=Sandarakinorhabdus fusca TaxID=1439888 RepID=A0A7C9GQL9_9SPHN|nr:ABC transporter permease [Polymorphobacter fuscus]KAB7644435.1 FtsX-like permease family protein [Polymorphobacter fuscus]MQT18357.1 FtsX-like permease family protein [Polymorphobacter fuscus]NJC08257.1 putative ABC transport system permease protein [Polymorphobacter fuscus]
MLHNYLTTGLRSLLRNRAFAAINILGLAIGMAACILLLLFVRYETSYDQWLPGHENAYQVNTTYHGRNTGRGKTSQMSAYVVGRTLAKDFPQIEKIAYVTVGNPVIMQDGVASTGSVTMADPEILDILQLPLARGDARTALRGANSLLLTETEAQRRYPGVDPIGKTLSIINAGRTTDYTITGILRDLPRNSHFAVKMLVPFSRLPYVGREGFFTKFGWNSGSNYLRLRSGASMATVNDGMQAWEKRNIPKEPVGDVMVSEGDDVDWKIAPVAGIHLSNAVDGQTPGNDPKSIATFALVAILILAMACINFTNLSTARAGQRAREVALRKVMGASRRQLIVQFLGESMVVAALSMLVALAIVELTLPSLSAFLQADLNLSYFGQGGVLLPIIGLVVIVGLAAGLYPAFVLSRFDPAPVLKSNRSGTDSQGSGKLRSALVVAQFAVSIALVICTAVVTAQTIYARSADPGYNRAGLLQVTGIGRKQIEAVADQIVTATANIPGVEAVGRTSIGVNTDSSINTSVRIEGNPAPINLGMYNVDPGFFDAMGLKPLAGRLLDTNNPRDDTRLPPGDEAAEATIAARGANTVITVEALTKLGFKTPADAIGKTIRVGLVDDKFGLVPVTIVGVVADLRLRSFRDPYDPIMFYYDRGYMTEMMVRMKAGEAGAIRDKVEAVWKRYAAQVPFQAEFTDEIVRKQYDADEARAKTFAAFAGLAIVVACLGLYGLAAFTAERRTREIGIRKVLGARGRDIVRLLVWEFSRPVLVANLIAWPVAWWLMRDWLDSFNARIDLGPQWFIGAGVLAAGIAAATIIGHALRVARQSPALALRYE